MRRNRPAVVAAALLAIACAPDREAPKQPSAAPDLHLIEGGFSRGMGPDGNTVIFDAEDGFLVIDTGRHPGHSAAILDYASAQKKPIRTIVNTHWHLDHTTGNADIKAAFPDAAIYATRAIETALPGFLARGMRDAEAALAAPDAGFTPAQRAEIEREIGAVRDPKALLPDHAVDGPMTLPVSGRALELNLAQNAVTAADIWIWDEATKTAIVGDLVTLPAPFLDTACADGWLKAFDAIESKDFTRLIPGHGPAMTPDQFRTYRRAFENLLECANANDGAACAARWTHDAAPLLNESDAKSAPQYVEYYVDQALKSDAHRSEFCGARN